MSLFFFNDTATTEIYTLSLHDALPISFCESETLGESHVPVVLAGHSKGILTCSTVRATGKKDRKSTRLNSSHTVISYAVFCLKKKKQTYTIKCELSVTPSEGFINH